MTELKTLVAIANVLDQKADWGVARTRLPDTPGGDVVAFGLARQVPVDSGRMVPSEALVLGPFDDFPNTRRSPVTALEIFVGIRADWNEKANAQACKANLADVHIEALPNQIFSKVWDSSIAARLGSLGGVDDSRAKAKVSFVIPLELAQALGCAP